MASSGSRDHEIAVLLFVLGLVFGAAIMFSQLSPRQRGLTLGATIIFLGTLFGIVAGLAGGATPGLIFGLSLSLVVSLLWTRLARVFMGAFFDEEVRIENKVSQPALNPADASTSALPPAQNAPGVEPTTNPMKEAEMAMPFSVTENTTKTLKNKQ
jgi:hypothetical protein